MTSLGWVHKNPKIGVPNTEWKIPEISEKDPPDLKKVQVHLIYSYFPFQTLSAHVLYCDISFQRNCCCAGILCEFTKVYVSVLNSIDEFLLDMKTFPIVLEI